MQQKRLVDEKRMAEKQQRGEKGTQSEIERENQAAAGKPPAKPKA